MAVGFFAVSAGTSQRSCRRPAVGSGLRGCVTVIVASLTPVGVAAAIGVAIVDHAVKNIVTIIGGVASMGGSTSR